MRVKTVWNDDISGFPVEFVNWPPRGEASFNQWNYYVYFTSKNTPAEFWEKLLNIAPGKYSIDYYNSFLVDIDWHGGITFAEFVRNAKQEIIAIKAGCDYSHYFDEGHEYTLEDLVQDATATVKSIIELFKVD